MSSFIDQLIKSPLIFFIIAAVVLIFLAIIGKIPFPNTIDLTAACGRVEPCDRISKGA